MVIGEKKKLKSGNSERCYQLLVNGEQDNQIIMKQFFALFLTILTGVSSVYANLGDGGDKIEDSYGNLVERHLLDDGSVSATYHKDQYLYFVIFVNGRSVLERYSRTDGAGLSPKEISKFLKANAARATWTQHDASKERKFERSDHKAEATYLNVDDRPTLTVRALDKSKSQKVD
jgi:phage/plasmid primase-like uncharacterized protein